MPEMPEYTNPELEEGTTPGTGTEVTVLPSEITVVSTYHYVTTDGKQYESDIEATLHQEYLNSFEGIRLFNPDLGEITPVPGYLITGENIMDSYYIYTATADNRDRISELCNITTVDGKPLPDPYASGSATESSPYVYWDSENEKWRNLDTTIENLTIDLNKFSKIRELMTPKNTPVEE